MYKGIKSIISKLAFHNNAFTGMFPEASFLLRVLNKLEFFLGEEKLIRTLKY